MNSFSETLMQNYSSIVAAKRSSAKGQVTCYRSVRLNDVEAVKTYKVAPEMAALLGSPWRADFRARRARLADHQSKSGLRSLGASIS